MTESKTGPSPESEPQEALVTEPHPLGAVLAVRVRAGGRNSAIQGVRAGELRISVTQVPEKGKANKVLAEILSRALAVPKSRIELISGPTSPRKRFLVHGLTPRELTQRVAAALGQV